jgi:hypothetical protein
MAELDKVPQKQSIEIETVKLDETLLEKITELNRKSTMLINDFGSIYIRKKELYSEIERLDTLLEKAEAEFKLINEELKDAGDEIDEKYPQSRINIQDGTVQYQPGAPTRKQLLEQQQQAPQA